MRVGWKLGIAFAVVVGAAWALAPGANATVAGSVHDFTGNAAYGTDQLCNPCHTPHFADITVTDAPLWNHTVTTATFQLYSSGTLDATVGQPVGVSKLCLSCHDGTVAIDSFGGAAGGDGSTLAAGHYANVTTDLRDDHPISFDYAAVAAADAEIRATPTGALPLFGGNLECATCHDVHDGTGNSDLLREPISGSAICLDCHIK